MAVTRHTKSKPLTIRLETRFVERLRARADQEEVSFNAIVSRGLREWEEKQPPIKRRGARKAIVAADASASSETGKDMT